MHLVSSENHRFVEHEQAPSTTADYKTPKGTNTDRPHRDSDEYATLARPESRGPAPLTRQANFSSFPTRLIGELCFQLDRRIFAYIFNSQDHVRRRFYGFTVRNIPYMINLESINPVTKEVDQFKKSSMTYRHKRLMRNLYKLGYRPKHHSLFNMSMVNRYGLFTSADQDNHGRCIQDPRTVRAALRLMCMSMNCTENELADMFIILDCAVYMSLDEDKPLFAF